MSSTMRRRGSLAVKTALALPVLAGIAAATVDLGVLYATRARSQNIADATALAAASGLGEPAEVRARAATLIEAHQVNGITLTYEPANVEIGTWDAERGLFSRESSDANAVRVTVPISVPTLFARVFGFDSFTLRRTAIATAKPVAPPFGGSCSVYAGRDLVVHDESLIDAFDSNEGPYGGNTATGSVCSAQGILVQDESTVWTDASSIDGIQTISESSFRGRARTLEAPLEFPTIPWDDVRVTNDNAEARCTACPDENPFFAAWPGVEQTVHVWAGQTLVLPPGVFYFDELDIRDGGRVEVLGPGTTHIYVTGDLTFRGEERVGSGSQSAPQLRIAVGGTRVEMGGEWNFYGSIIAPDADVTLRDEGGFYGALVAGGEVTVSDETDVHIDTAIDPWLTVASSELVSGSAIRLVR